MKNTTRTTLAAAYVAASLLAASCGGCDGTRNERRIFNLDEVG